jgi:hypothetical protein
MVVFPRHADAQYAKGPSQLPPQTVVARLAPGARLERSADGGHTWEPVRGMPTRVLPASRAGEPLPLTAFAVAPPNPSDPGARSALARSPGVKRPGYHVVTANAPALAAVGNRLFVSRDGLATWTEVDTGETINGSTYITALAIDPSDPDHWLAGTSYDGLYRTRDAGDSWTDLTEQRDLWPTYLGAGFFEEINAISFTAHDYVVLTTGFGQGFLRMDLDPLRVRRLTPLADGDTAYAIMRHALSQAAPEPSSYTITGDTGPDDGARAAAATEPSDATDPLRAAARREIAGDKTGIYLAAENARPEKLPGYFDSIERHGFNSIVVDFKNDLGHITYASEVATAREAGAVAPVIDPADLVEAAHERGIYVIARIVVFKDPKLHAYDDHRYAVWDERLDRPWGVFRTYTDEETGERRTIQVERWVDAYSPDVWRYNIDIAREVAAFGVDEIQFDYIRFPSDGRTDDIELRHAVPGADRVQALEGFLSAAREAIDLPISIDVFGFNAWARMSYLGQDIERLAAYVDVISPMFYPSHFARSFLPQFSYLDRAALIYDLGTRRARRMAKPPCDAQGPLIRPYIQAFLIGAELDFDVPTYRRYLDLQVEASEQAQASGYTLWNASGRYYMLP